MEDLIYLEVDSEITEAIDKLKDAKGAEVKLVVPARSSLLQSAVNIKLLKKAAEAEGKKLALITNDKTAKFLAGRIGIAVASNVKSDPKIPELPEEAEQPDIDEAAEIAEADAKEAAEKASKSKKSSDKATSEKKPESEPESPLSTRSIGEEDESATQPEKKKTKKSKIPDYNRFQKRLFGVLAIALGLIALIVLINLLPSAKVIIATKADKKAVDIDFTVDSTLTSSNIENGKIAGKKLTLDKELSADFTATGKKDVGTKSTGTISISNSASSTPISLAAGTILTSSSKTFSLNQDTTVPGASVSNGNIVPGKVNAAITATAAGDSYNLSGATFSVAGQSASVAGSGSTTGGTSKQITVVSQDDVNKAKTQLLDGDKQKSQTELTDKAGKSVTVFTETFAQTVPTATTSVPVDSEASSASVKASVQYSVLTAENSVLDELFDYEIENDLSDNNEVYQNGRESAKYALAKLVSPDNAQLNATSDAYVGAKIDKTAVTKAVRGKSKKNVSDIVKTIVPSANSVTVEGLPFWPWMPQMSSHINVEIKILTD